MSGSDEELTVRILDALAHHCPKWHCTARTALQCRKNVLDVLFDHGKAPLYIELSAMLAKSGQTLLDLYGPCYCECHVQ